MEESYENCQGKGGEESEELKHICVNDDNESFYSLSSASSEEEIPKDKTNVQDYIIPTDDASLEYKHNVSRFKHDAQNLTSSADHLSDNQCVDDGSASVPKQCFDKSSVSDETNSTFPCEQARKFDNSDTFSDNAWCFSDSDTCSVIYQRVLEDSNLQSINSRNPSRADERSFERSTSCTDECPLHKGEIIKYVCTHCNKLACQACCTIDHKSCLSPAYIPSLIVNPEFKFGEKCKHFEEELDRVSKRLQLSKGKAHSNLKACEIMKMNAKAQFKKQREELNRIFDCLEQDFDRKVSEIENNGKEKIKELMLKQDHVAKVFQETVLDYEKRKDEGNSSRIFTKIDMSKEIMKVLNTDLTNIDMNNEVERYIYTPSKYVLDFKRNITELGKIQFVNSNSKNEIKDVITINVKTKIDQKSCQISGLVLLSKRHLLAADFANSAIKVVDIYNHNDVITVPVMPAPFDVTKVNDKVHDSDTVTGQMVMTLPKENKLRVMDYTLPSSFKATRDIETNGMCRAVHYYDSKLFVTFPRLGKIEIIEMNGLLLKRITTDTIGQLFQPLSIAMDSTEGKLFVSDKDNHTVFCMNTDGDVIAIFNDHDLVEPRGICVNDMTGAVFVCSFSSHKVYHLSSSCRLISTMTVADDTSLAPFPFSVAFSDRNNVIYVGQFAQDCIKAYRLG